MGLGFSKKADLDKLIFRPQDPKKYGQICPVCQKRWGEPSIQIDVVRCEQCPPFVESGICWWGLKAKRAEKKRLKELKL